MTTPAAEKLYLAQHLVEWEGKGYAIYNPNNLPIEQLPVIYGFNNGGSSKWLEGVILAESGVFLGGHICSDEGYMPHDLGVLEGSRPDRHLEFKEHYPNGYRMDFVSARDVANHKELDAAYQKNQQMAKEAGK